MTRGSRLVGHRLPFILLHVVHAFLNACARRRLGPKWAFGDRGTVKVLSLLAACFSASMGILVFLIFGLAKHQILWRSLSAHAKRLCCVPVTHRRSDALLRDRDCAGYARLAGLDSVGSLTSLHDAAARHRHGSRDRLVSFDVNEVS